LADKDAQRVAAEKKCQKYEKELGTAQRSLERFEGKDLPQFQEWFAAEFGPVREEFEKLEAKFREVYELVRDVEEEHFFGGGSLRDCYERVLYEREHPDEFEDEGFDDAVGDAFEDEEEARDFFDGIFGSSGKGGESASGNREQDLRDLFADLTGVDIDPEDPMFKEVFESFKKQFGFDEEGMETLSARKAPASRDLKKLYRTLARKLHPDHQEDLDPSVQKKLDALWHETQEAYAHGELERLQRIESIIDIEVNGIDERTEVDRILDFAEQHRIELRATQREIRQARKHPAWMFSKKPQVRERLEVEINGDFTEQIRLIKQDIAHCEKKIESWSKPARKRKKSGRKNASTRRAGKPPAGQRTAKAGTEKTEDDKQFEMPF